MKPLVSSVRVERAGVHDVVGVWNRGGKAGLLTVAPGDGYVIAARLAGRAPAVSDTACDHESAADVVARELGNVREELRMVRSVAVAAAIPEGAEAIDRVWKQLERRLATLVAAVEALPR